MMAGAASGRSPIPEPIPRAVVATVVGDTAPKPLLTALAVGLYLADGGLFGALLVRYAGPVTIAGGLGLGVVLWLVTQVALLPLLGWGLFGTAITPAIAVATLLLHLVYGATLGVAMDRDRTGTSGRTSSTAD